MSENGIQRFNLRVYAIIMRGDSVLLADEVLNGFAFTKFPGGGVELGEGLADALARELMEEGGIRIRHVTHFYTTDFFQRSAFYGHEQIVSVYYRVEADFDWTEYESDQSLPGKAHSLRLYFAPLHSLLEEQLTFPIDRKVLEMLQVQI